MLKIFILNFHKMFSFLGGWAVTWTLFLGGSKFKLLINIPSIEFPSRKFPFLIFFFGWACPPPPTAAVCRDNCHYLDLFWGVQNPKLLFYILVLNLTFTFFIFYIFLGGHGRLFPLRLCAGIIAVTWTRELFMAAHCPSNTGHTFSYIHFFSSSAF